MATGFGPNRWLAWLMSHTDSPITASGDSKEDPSLTALPLRLLLSIREAIFSNPLSGLQKRVFKPWDNYSRSPPAALLSAVASHYITGCKH